MARKRVISPEMFTSETVAALPVTARYTWIGLLCYFDDFGRGKDNAALVKATVWPLDADYETRRVQADLDMLAEHGMICRYLCCGWQIHSPAWLRWQKVSHPTPTKLCPCPTHEPDAYGLHRQELEPNVVPLQRDSGGLREVPGESPRNVVEVNESQCSSSGSGFEDFVRANAALRARRSSCRS